MKSGSWLTSDAELEACLDEAGVAVHAGPLRELKSKIGAKRVATELAKLTAAGAADGNVARGFRVAELSPQCWRVDMFNFGSELSAELEEKGLHVVTLVVAFEGGFPVSDPPSLRIVAPRMDWKRSGATLSGGGVVQPEQGWWKAQAMETVLGTTVRQALQECRIDREATQPCYTEEDWVATLTRATLPPLASAGPVFRQEYALVASRTLREGNKIVLPTSALRALTRDGEEPLPSPLVLELQAAGRPAARTHVGVWEFSADEGSAEAPQWVLDNVRATGGGCCVRLVSLPRCTYLKLQPFSKRFLKVNGNDRNKVLASLAASIQRFAAFTVGDVVELMHDGEPFLFFVLDTKPEKAVTCIAQDSWVEMEIDFVQSVDFAESADSLTTSTGEAGGGGGMKLGMQDGEGSVCGHCKHRIPAASLVMHEVACARRNTCCDRCGAVVSKAAWQEHLATAHALVACAAGCGEQIEAYLMKRHAVDDCRERKVSCPFCGVFGTAKNMAAHEESCGNKSFRCEDCGRLLRAKERQGHKCEAGSSAWYCPLCVGGDPMIGEREFVAHLEKQHSKAAKEVCLACPICISEGSIGINDPPPPLLAHLELHKYRLRMKTKR